MALFLQHMSKKTKVALGAALRDLLKKKGLDRIKISEITDTAGVNRQTFYYHFQDIYDLVEWSLSESFSYLSSDPHIDFEECLSAILANFLAEKPVIMNIVSSYSSDQVERYLSRTLDPFLRSRFLSLTKGNDVIDEGDLAFLVRFYRHGIVGTISDWIRSGMKEEPSVLVARLSKVACNDRIAKSIRYFARPVENKVE